ncbi:MAG: hypothetical protein GMKNLPBB_01481 [Myxococcota bacterium]|nr:hypothetical protein [Myxococcota bacterium]
MVLTLNIAADMTIAVTSLMGLGGAFLTWAAAAKIVLLGLGGAYFLIWLWQAYSNLQVLGQPPRWTPVQAVGAFVAPVLNLYRPYQVMVELWDNSTAPLIRAGRTPEKCLLIKTWWMSVLSCAVVLGISLYTGSRVAITLLEVLNVISVMFALVITRTISEQQASALEVTVERAPG